MRNYHLEKKTANGYKLISTFPSYQEASQAILSSNEARDYRIVPSVKKQKKIILGKTNYLLGKNEEGQKVWLLAPSWDCGHYWGFGYVEIYNKLQTDLESHEHVNSSLLGMYNDKKREYCSNIFDARKFEGTAFTEKEGWKLSELFETFYHLKEQAEFYNLGGMHTSENPLANMLKNKDLADKINKELLPKVFDAIIAILSPDETTKEENEMLKKEKAIEILKEENEMLSEILKNEMLNEILKRERD